MLAIQAAVEIFQKEEDFQELSVDSNGSDPELLVPLGFKTSIKKFDSSVMNTVFDLRKKTKLVLNISNEDYGGITFYLTRKNLDEKIVSRTLDETVFESWNEIIAEAPLLDEVEGRILPIATTAESLKRRIEMPSAAPFKTRLT